MSVSFADGVDVLAERLIICSIGSCLPWQVPSTNNFYPNNKIRARSPPLSNTAEQGACRMRGMLSHSSLSRRRDFADWLVFEHTDKQRKMIGRQDYTTWGVHVLRRGA